MAGSTGQKGLSADRGSAGLSADRGSAGLSADRGSAGLSADRGSAMAIVLIVTLVITALVGALASETLLAARRGTAVRDGAAAAAAAELAVAEAGARIAQGATAGFTGTVAVQGGSAAYTAVRVGVDAWDVSAQGEVGGRRRALSVGFGREAQFPYALFVDEALTLRSPTGVVSGRVGTNGTMDLTGLAPGSAQELFRPAATCSGCTNPVVREGPYPLAEATVPATTRPCPAAGRFEGTVDGAGGVPVWCGAAAVPVSFGAVSVVNGPLVVLVGPGVALSLDGAQINVGGAPDGFRLHKLEPTTGATSTVSANGARIAGLFHAPRTAMTSTALTVTGSVVVDRLTVSPGGALSLSWSPALQTFGATTWRVTRWSEVGAT